MFTASYGPGRTAGFGDVPGFPSPSNANSNFEALTAFNARTVNTGSVPEVTKITMDFEGDPAPQLYTGKQRGQQGDPMLVINKPEFNHVSGQMRPKQACALSVGIVNRILREKPEILERYNSDLSEFEKDDHFRQINDIVSVFSFAGLLLHLKGDATGSDNGPKAGSHYMRQRQAAVQIKGLVSQCPNLWVSNSTPLPGDYGYFVLCQVMAGPETAAELIARMEKAINHPGTADFYPGGDKYSLVAKRGYRQSAMHTGNRNLVWQFLPVLVRQCRIGNIRRLLRSDVFFEANQEFAFFRVVQFKELVPIRSDHVPISAVHCALGEFTDSDVAKDGVYGIVPRAELYICTDFDDPDSCPRDPTKTQSSTPSVGKTIQARSGAGEGQENKGQVDPDDVEMANDLRRIQGNEPGPISQVSEADQAAALNILRSDARTTARSAPLGGQSVAAEAAEVGV